MHPVPVVHGMTVGEFAQMINGEGWLEGKRKCELEVITLKNWEHKDEYLLPLRPFSEPSQRSGHIALSIDLFF